MKHIDETLQFLINNNFMVAPLFADARKALDKYWQDKAAKQYVYDGYAFSVKTPANGNIHPCAVIAVKKTEEGKLQLTASLHAPDDKNPFDKQFGREVAFGRMKANFTYTYVDESGIGVNPKDVRCLIMAKEHIAAADVWHVLISLGMLRGLSKYKYEHIANNNENFRKFLLWVHDGGRKSKNQ